VSATPEQPPAAPDEPVTAIHAPTFAAPAFEPAPPIAEPAAADRPGGEFIEKHPEALVGGAFAGGAVLALVLKRLGRR
jgi:hypothetical protein